MTLNDIDIKILFLLLNLIFHEMKIVSQKNHSLILAFEFFQDNLAMFLRHKVLLKLPFFLRYKFIKIRNHIE